MIELTLKVDFTSYFLSLHTVPIYYPPDTAAVGRNLGATDPFYDEEIIKKGQTGGIMDYGS